MSICRGMKIEPYFSPSRKINFKWIKVLHVKPKTLKMLNENLGRTLEDIGAAKDFLNRPSFAQELKQTTEKWHVIKLKSICAARKQLSQEEVHKVEETFCQLYIQ